MVMLSLLQRPPVLLLPFDRLDQRLEVALDEALVLLQLRLQFLPDPLLRQIGVMMFRLNGTIFVITICGLSRDASFMVYAIYHKKE